MASPFTELEVCAVLFSLLVFSLFTLSGMLREHWGLDHGPHMELPFSGFELTFIILAFFIFSLFSLMSVCFQPESPPPDSVVCEVPLRKSASKKPSKQRGSRQVWVLHRCSSLFHLVGGTDMREVQGRGG
uniref:Uncharacterized protein n=1 Tax=Knipowitschia caucasica TaxID=637954 RepID=A0AAV2LL79_KNICA